MPRSPAYRLAYGCAPPPATPARNADVAVSGLPQGRVMLLLAAGGVPRAGLGGGAPTRSSKRRRLPPTRRIAAYGALPVPRHAEHMVIRRNAAYPQAVDASRRVALCAKRPFHCQTQSWWAGDRMGLNPRPGIMSTPAPQPYPLPTFQRPSASGACLPRRIHPL